MREVLRLVRPSNAALAIALGVATVLSGAALLAASGALITGASLRPESLLVLLPLITSVRLFAVSRAGFRYAERVVSHDLTLRVVGGLRDRLLRKLVPLAPAALLGVRGGDLLARLRADVDELQGAWVRVVGPSVVACVAGAIAVAFTALVSPLLAAVLVALLIVLGVLVPAWAVRAGRRGSVEAAEADAAFGAEALDLLRGLPDHLVADGGRSMVTAINRELARQEAAEKSSARVLAVTAALREGVPVFGVVAALWLVGWQVATASTHPALLAATALGVLGAFEAVAGLGPAWAAVGGLRAAARRVDALDQLTPMVADSRAGTQRPELPILRFEDVTLSYPGTDRRVLRHFDLDIEPGAKIALVGSSGVGKSSVLSLAMRFYDPSGGRVLLGGVDVRDLRLDQVRGCFAWAAQTPQILGGGLAGNLRLADPTATDADLSDVLVDVGLGSSDARLHEWVGESGERLSAGERGRLGVARAILSPAPYLLLDEPTANLDPVGARALLDRLVSDRRGVVLVTHNPALLDRRWRIVDLGL